MILLAKFVLRLILAKIYYRCEKRSRKINFKKSVKNVKTWQKIKNTFKTLNKKR